jgi:hypothetical protein
MFALKDFRDYLPHVTSRLMCLGKIARWDEPKNFGTYLYLVEFRLIDKSASAAHLAHCLEFISFDLLCDHIHSLKLANSTYISYHTSGCNNIYS